MFKKKNKALTTTVQNRSLCAYSDLIWKIPKADKYQPNELCELSCFGTHVAILGELIDADVVTSCDESTDIFTIFGTKVEEMSLELWEMMLSYVQHELTILKWLANITWEKRSNNSDMDVWCEKSFS